MSTNPIIFLHIGKASGSSFRKILKRVYSTRNIFEVSAKGKGNEEILSIPLNKRKKLGLVAGHMYFGIHELLSEGAKYIVILRNPLQRSFSNYHYIRENPNHWLHKKITSEGYSYSDYLKSDLNDQTRNHMCMVIAGHRKEDGPCTEATLEKALQNIENHFAAVGITERFDDSLLLFKKKLNWQDYPVFFIKNKTFDGKKKPKVTPDEKALFDELNALDNKLYDIVKEKFEAEFEKDKAFFEKEKQIFIQKNNEFRSAFLPKLKHNLDAFIRKIFYAVKKLIG